MISFPSLEAYNALSAEKSLRLLSVVITLYRFLISKLLNQVWEPLIHLVIFAHGPNLQGPRCRPMLLSSEKQNRAASGQPGYLLFLEETRGLSSSPRGEFIFSMRFINNIN